MLRTIKRTLLGGTVALAVAALPLGVLILLRQGTRGLFRARLRAQNGQRGSSRAIATASLR